MNITILGAGAYGLCLARKFVKNNNKVIVWSKVESEIIELTKTKMNKKALGNFVMPNNIIYTTNTKMALEGSQIVVLAVATKFLPSVCEEIKPYIKDNHIVIASKGINEEYLDFASNIVREILNTKKLCTISGPSFAKDMANDELIGLSLATTNNKTKNDVINSLESNTLKIRTTSDFIGVELCGTMKNVIALISGMLDGLKASESTKAMFLTESINDVRHLIKKMGGSEKTILSYAGFGDIILTCTSTTSRNYTYGKMIGEKVSKKTKDEYLNNNTVEGLYTIKSVKKLIQNHNIKMPFINIVNNIIENNLSPNVIFEFLLTK